MTKNIYKIEDMMGLFGLVEAAGSKGVPPNIYRGELLGVEPVPENKEKGYKPGYMFKFKILEGEHAGSTTTRICGGTVPKVGTMLGKFLSEITGLPLVLGTDFDAAFQQSIGKPYTVVVKQTDSGGTRVDTVMPA